MDIGIHKNSSIEMTINIWELGFDGNKEHATFTQFPPTATTNLFSIHHKHLDQTTASLYIHAEA
jgi:hypothetical protein